jgi:hypothetical protein
MLVTRMTRYALAVEFVKLTGISIRRLNLSNDPSYQHLALAGYI